MNAPLSTIVVMLTIIPVFRVDIEANNEKYTNICSLMDKGINQVTYGVLDSKILVYIKTLLV